MLGFYWGYIRVICPSSQEVSMQVYGGFPKIRIPFWYPKLDAVIEFIPNKCP